MGPIRYHRSTHRRPTQWPTALAATGKALTKKRSLAITIYHCSLATDLGELLLASDPKGLRGVWFVGQKYAGVPEAHWRYRPDLPLLRAACSQIEEYLSGKRQEFELTLSLHGTDFQRAVWHALGEIPYGKTMSYGEFVRRIGRPSAVRAAAAAAGKNPVSIVVPCHRLIGARGALTGYAGGLERKHWLLEREQR